MKITSYKHIKYVLKPNKNKIPINHFTFEQLDEFNKIYAYVKDRYMLVKHTLSQGISNKISERLHERYFVVKGNQRFELVVICAEGCYRFLLQNKKKEGNTITGQQACRSLYKWADNYNIDLSKYITTDGLEIKKQIEQPHIQVLNKLVLNTKLHHVYHIDFRSSYASRICEAYPELKPMYDDIFKHRGDNNDYYKHVLTNSIGCWQSLYCVDYNSRHRTVPYQFAGLSKIAINGTRAKIEDMIIKLRKKGMVPLLTNTDGIWYWSDRGQYHDKDEGDNLCNWQTDHINCDFLMCSEGRYQYVENGVCHTVVRGLCNLDISEPDRDKWQFGDIMKIHDLLTYRFDEKLGVVKTYEN